MGHQIQPLLEVENVSLTYRSRQLVGRSRDTHAVRSVSFMVAKGESFGVVGESGSGKSSLAKAILGLETPTGGRITVDGTDLSNLPRATRARQVQMVFQDSHTSLNPRRLCGDIVLEPLVLHGEGAGRVQRARVRDLFSLVGLPPSFLTRFPRELSGGQRQRVNIARALACDPRIIIADEPTSALDVTIKGQILELFESLTEELGLSFVVITHDLSVVTRMCKHVGVMHQGHLVETGRAEEVYANPTDPYTQRLVAATPTPDPAAERERRAERKRLAASA